MYKTSAVQEMSSIVSWEMSSCLGLTFLDILFRHDIEDILFSSGPLSTGVCLGTRPGSGLISSSHLEQNVKTAQC